MKSFLKYFAFAFFLSSVSLAQHSKVIELRSADRLEGKIINNEEVRELIGNVHFVQLASGGGLVKVWCDRALRFIKQNKIELYGNVKVIRDSVIILSNEGVYYGERRVMEGKKGVKLTQGKTILTAEEGEYFVDEKRSHFVGNVVLTDPTSIIKCNEMVHFENETKSIATNNVHVFDISNAVDIYGDSLIHIERNKITLVQKNPRLVKIDTSSTGSIDTMVVISRVMQSLKDTIERFIAIDSVQMIRGDLSSRCGNAIYFVQTDIILLQKNPIIWSANNQITGDTIRIKIENNKLRSLFSKNRAMAISLADTGLPNRYNQLTGRELIMYFHDDKLEHIDAQKNAISLYYLFDNDQPNGVNKSSGDRIFIDFIDGNVDRIKIVGGVQGNYFPEKMILNKESEYNLDGFRLFTNRPKRQGTHIIGK